MRMAYSTDLRTKALDYVEKGGLKEEASRESLGLQSKLYSIGSNARKQAV